MGALGEADIVRSHAPAYAQRIAEISHRQHAPDAGIVEAGVMIGDCDKGRAIGPILYRLEQAISIMHLWFVEDNYSEKETLRISPG